MKIRSTTVCAVVHNGQVAIGADGQATMGNTVAKSNVKKIRKLQEGKIVTGFAGSTADAFTLLERFDEKLSTYGGNMKRAAIELAKDWRMDRYLRKLEAMLIVANNEEVLIVSGTGDVLEPDHGIATIGSGSMYAQAAAQALMNTGNKDLTAEDIVRESLGIAADICIYTNHNLVIETLDYKMSTKILHNPRCGKSRQTLKLLHERGENVQVVEYLKKCPSFDEMKDIITKTGLKPFDIIRKGEKVYKENFKDKELSDDEWILAMLENPILIERPIVIKGSKAALGRPPEQVEAIL